MKTQGAADLTAGSSVMEYSPELSLEADADAAAVMDGALAVAVLVVVVEVVANTTGASTRQGARR